MVNSAVAHSSRLLTRYCQLASHIFLLGEIWRHRRESPIGLRAQELTCLTRLEAGGTTQWRRPVEYRKRSRRQFRLGHVPFFSRFRVGPKHEDG